MINKLVSSKSIIAKIIADLDLQEEEIKISDFMEWIGEANEKIGAVTQCIQKETVLKVSGYQTKLPSDLNTLYTVAFSFTSNGGWIPLKRNTSNFTLPDAVTPSNVDMLISGNNIVPLVKNLFGYTTDREAIDKLNEDINTKQTLSTLLNQYTVPSVNGTMQFSNSTNFSNTLQYMLKPGYIVTNVENGYIKLSYDAIAVDIDGYPMIPDNQSYFEAIYWYVTMKFKYPLYLNGKMPQYIYFDIRNSWNFYRKQAYAEALMPTQDELENIKNTWTKLIPVHDDNRTFLSNISDEQLIYNYN